MSTIWTPSGERPIRSEPEPQPSSPPGAPRQEELSEEELRAQVEEVQRQLLEAPVEVVIANHCVGLFQLAVLHLEQPTPNLPQAQLAIDAMAAMVEGLGVRLGSEEAVLRDALTQIRLAYVQRKRGSGSTQQAAGS